MLMTAEQAEAMLQKLVPLERNRLRQAKLLCELRAQCYRALALHKGKKSVDEYQHFVQECDQRFWSEVREDKP
jgi:hypothetical protein